MARRAPVCHNAAMTSTLIHLAEALGHEATDKRIDILRRIRDAGSISEAARVNGVSYKAAWQAIETLTNLAGTPLVEKVVGGSGGGGAQLTVAGERLLQAAQRLTTARQAVLAQIEGETSGQPPLGGLAILGLRTSMRNQLPCTVRGLTHTSGAARVQLALADGSELVSRITLESAELLGLRPGQSVFALCKAAAVRIARELPQPPGYNRLDSVVTRSSPSASGGEMSVRLTDLLQLVGFAAPGHRLRVGSKAQASIEESGVVIAVSA